MKNCFEEEFILDVLQNYTTYKSYYKIREKGEIAKHGEPEPDSVYETRRAYKKLKTYVEGHEMAIAEKARMMIDHFRKNVSGLIRGKARAMVVTRSIEAAMIESYYIKPRRSVLASVISRVAEAFEQELEQDGQIAFKSNAKSFVRTYGYLSKILDFNQPDWEKRWLFLKHLIPKLKVADDEPDENILEAVDMDSYQIQRIGTANIALNEDGNIIEPIPVSNGAGKPEQEYDTLERIIQEFNQRFGNVDWGDGIDPKAAAQILAEQIPDKMKTDTEMLQSIKNSDKDNAKITSDAKVLDLMQALMFTHTGVYKKMMDDTEFRNQYQEFVFDAMLKYLNQGDAEHPEGGYGTFA